MKNFFIKYKYGFISVAFIILVSVLGGVFVRMGDDFFSTVTKPTQWVPDFVFAVVWTLIYVIYAVTFFHFSGEGLLDKKLIFIGLINGLLNVLWCLVYFALGNSFGGMVIIIINAFFATLLAKSITEKGQKYTFLCWLYPLWLYLATALDLAVWILN